MEFQISILTILGTLLSIVAYFLGSLPTGYLVAKRQGIDIREHGSGSTGATNVWRVVGRGWGVLVFAVDFAKGIGALWLAGFIFNYFSGNLPEWGLEWLLVVVALGVIVGHSLPIWLQWRGGKSVATGLGVIFWLHWQTALMALGIWLGVMAISRTVSLSSLVAVLSSLPLLILWQAPVAYQVLAGVGSMYIVYAHRGNIQRLLKGEEHSFAPKT